MQHNSDTKDRVTWTISYHLLRGDNHDNKVNSIGKIIYIMLYTHFSFNYHSQLRSLRTGFCSTFIYFHSRFIPTRTKNNSPKTSYNFITEKKKMDFFFGHRKKSLEIIYLFNYCIHSGLTSLQSLYSYITRELFILHYISSVTR